MLRIAHIINPVKVSNSSDLYTAQPITFESMRVAKEKAKGKIAVELFTTQYPEDHAIIPDYFTVLPDLKRSVLDMANFERPRKFPLIQDILDCLAGHSEADYFIYTNVDIGLMPNFYTWVAERIEEGHDALIINRRRLEDRYHSVKDLPKIYLDKGKSHPGFDCFVFHRSIYPKIRLDAICVGAPFIGVTLAHNLICFAKNLRLFDEEWLTFHIGMLLFPKRDPAYYWYNRKQFDVIWKEHFLPVADVRKFPYADRNVFVRYWKWGRNPSLFVFKLLKLDLGRIMRHTN